MLPRWLWAALVASLVLALTAVSRPASATPAGFCDDRAASAIAQVPALEALDEAAWLVPTPCATGDPFTCPSVAPSHRGPAGSSGAATYALIASREHVARAQSDPLELSLALGAAALGVRWRVERPPRS